MSTHILQTKDKPRGRPLSRGITIKGVCVCQHHSPPRYASNDRFLLLAVTVTRNFVTIFFSRRNETVCLRLDASLVCEKKTLYKLAFAAKVITADLVDLSLLGYQFSERVV